MDIIYFCMSSVSYIPFVCLFFFTQDLVDLGLAWPRTPGVAQNDPPAVYKMLGI